MSNTLHIWCDGACAGNPGPGGYACAMHIGNGQYRYHSGHADYTTNNRMELNGFISALVMAANEAASGFDGYFIIRTDSKYIENAINCKWLDKWSKTGFQKIKNPDLWATIYGLLSKMDNISVEHVKGHSGVFENELVDRLAKESMSMRRISTGVIEL